MPGWPSSRGQRALVVEPRRRRAGVRLRGLVRGEDRLLEQPQVRVNEIAALEPALLADDAPGALRGNSNPTAIRTKVKLVNGRGYVFAYNTTNTRTAATFTWATAPGLVTVDSENRTLVATGTAFTDSFGPDEAHVYVLAPPPPRTEVGR